MSQNFPPAPDPAQQPQQPYGQQPQPYAQQQPYAQPQYPAAPQVPQYPAPQISHYPPPAPPQYPVSAYGVPVMVAPPTNSMAVAAFITAFLLPCLVPVVLGHIALGQIKRSREGGRGFAIAALIIGYIELAVWVILIGLLIIGIFFAASVGTAAMTTAS